MSLGGVALTEAQFAALILDVIQCGQFVIHECPRLSAIANGLKLVQRKQSPPSEVVISCFDMVMTHHHIAPCRRTASELRSLSWELILVQRNAFDQDSAATLA